jgi:hypothetical protein
MKALNAFLGVEAAPDRLVAHITAARRYPASSRSGSLGRVSDDRSASREVRATSFNGIATFTADGVEHPFRVRLVMREEGAHRQIAGHLIGVSREEILGLGPVVTCTVSGLIERSLRCVVHVDGSFESL